MAAQGVVRHKLQESVMRHLLALMTFAVSAISPLPSSADEADDTNFMLKGNWATLSLLKDPAMKVDIESNSIRRDQYPQVIFSIRYVLTGPESGGGLPSEYGRYNVKVVKMALDCEDKTAALYQNLYWLVDHKAGTVAFKGKNWGDSTWRNLGETSFFWDVWPAICHR